MTDEFANGKRSIYVDLLGNVRSLQKWKVCDRASIGPPRLSLLGVYLSVVSDAYYTSDRAKVPALLESAGSL